MRVLSPLHQAQRQLGSLKLLTVDLAQRQSLLNLPLEPLHLGQQDGALDRIHAPAHTDTGMVITALLPVRAHFTHDFCQRVVVGEHGTTISITT